ncbi:hypothetical protein [Paenibacillus apis]|uniref:Uncharacterized protein n=1 Tax=Paenibacillus apis TaxID=1792174 RepID=A0A920CL70_9BACL|nr:hypothetical protein [Paenibacillus apis]GIO41319.1 hypothetical protein J41TS4_10770 [Paenibacillus apis]
MAKMSVSDQNRLKRLANNPKCPLENTKVDVSCEAVLPLRPVGTKQLHEGGPTYYYALLGGVSRSFTA